MAKVVSGKAKKEKTKKRTSIGHGAYSNPLTKKKNKGRVKASYRGQGK